MLLTTNGGGGAVVATGAVADGERAAQPISVIAASAYRTLLLYIGFLQYPFGLQPIGQLGFMLLASH